jgi:hypothetical protein
LSRIIQSAGSNSVHYKYDDSTAVPTLLVKNGSGYHSAYGNNRKEKLIERWFKNLRMQSESLYAITGFGDGSHIRHFMDNSSGGTHFLVVEKEPSILRETFSRFDVSEILMNDRFMLGTGQFDDLFFKDIQDAAMLNIFDVNSLVFSPLHSTDEAYYDQARNELIRQYLVIRPLMEVNLRTGVNLQENTMENLEHMISSPDIGELTDQFRDIPFILVGAGPSLDESIEFLREMQDHAIIVASNSPYRKLINSGIKPHLVVTADPMSPTLAGFQNVSLEGVPLACPYSAYPEIVRRFSGRIISWLNVNPIVEMLKQSWKQKPGTPIMEQGTVSGCVLDISRVLGCRKVMFVGQDMCVRDDGKYYTDDSFYADSGEHYSSNKKGQLLPGNTQDEVLVEGRLFVYLKTFEKFISENNHVEYRNLARTGVKINDAPFIEYEQAIQWAGKSQSSKAFSSAVEKLLFNETENRDLANSISPLINFAQDLLELTLSLAIETEMLPDKFSGTNYSSNKKVIELLNKSAKVNKLIDSNPLYWKCILDGKTKSELALYRRISREISFPNENWTAVQKNKEYFWAISEGAHWFLDMIETKMVKVPRINNLT